MVSQDEMIRRQVLEAAEQLGETSVSCDIVEGHIILDGVVSSDEHSYQLEDTAGSIPGVRSVANELMIEGFSADVDNVVEGVDLTPDFTAGAGTGIPEEAVSEAEPYFPPTDPVVKPDRSPNGIEILGGFAETAADDLDPSLSGRPRGDDEVREAVLAALHRDAATTDLAVEVEVEEGVVRLMGTVSSLDDIDLAESVAASVAGVEEVEEELEVEGI